MAKTRANAVDDLRDRIGEPNVSTWTTDASGGTWLQSDIHRYLNRAASKVSEDCIIRGAPDEPPLALLIDIAPLTLRALTYKYELPGTIIDPLMVLHKVSDTFREIPSASIRHLLNDFDPASTSDTILAYELGESKGKVITFGLATGGSNTALDDTDRTSHAVYGFAAGTGAVDDGGAAIGVDDLVRNLTDGSVGTITAVTDSDTLTFSGGLSGGDRNTFEAGDRFEVVQAEFNRRTLLIYPPPSSTDASVAIDNSGTSDTTINIGNVSGTEYWGRQSVLQNNADVIGGMTIYLGAKTGTPKGNLMVRLETNSGGDPSGTLVSPISKGSIKTPTVSAGNYVDFQGEVNVAANTLYHLVVSIPAQSGYYASPSNNYYTWQADDGNGYANGTAGTYNAVSWTTVSGQDQLFKLHRVSGDEDLVVHYARYPAALATSTTLLENPDYAYEATMLWAEYLAFRAKGQIQQSIASKQMYDVEIERVKTKLQDHQQHPFTAIKNVMWAFPNFSQRLPRRRNDKLITFTS